MRKLTIPFGEILSCVHKNSVQQNGVLKSYIIIINYCHIIYHYRYCKICYREREQNTRKYQSVFWHPRVDIYKKFYIFPSPPQNETTDLIARHVSI
jgi:hypothetical protein